MTMQPRVERPPIYDDFLIEHQGRWFMNPVWADWFNNLYSALGDSVVAANSSDANKQIPCLQLLPITTTFRDTAINPEDGLLIYNSTLNEAQVRAAGVWKNI